MDSQEYVLRDIYTDLFLTISVPKSQELVATPYRHDGKDNAELFFMNEINGHA